MKIAVPLVLVFLPWAAAQFDWGNSCEGGQGSFEQDIPLQGDGVLVGEVPAGKRNIEIKLESPTDVDVQLFDVEAARAPIIQWGVSNALLGWAGSEACASYQSVRYCYSGFNGDQMGNRGNEWIRVEGSTNRRLEMRAWGYDRAGTAKVIYSWEEAEDCVDGSGSGSGSFNQAIVRNAVVEVGKIPAGLSSVRIFLEANNDVDIQLFDGSTAIVQWLPTDNGNWVGGIMGKPPGTAETATYQGMEIRYSGYNGFNKQVGSEYITISETTRELTMKAYGYRAGSALVNYAWGNEDVKLSMDFATFVDAPAVFNALSRRDDVPGALGIREVKFVVLDVQASSPTVHFANTKIHELHFNFARDALSYTLGVGTFLRDSYWSASRVNMVGSILFHSSFERSGTVGAYTLEFWPMDPVQTPLVTKVYNLIKSQMDFGGFFFFYHPVGDTQLAVYEQDRSQYESAGVAVIQADELFASVTFSGLNPGRGVGFLRVFGPGSSAPSIRDIAIFTFVPPDLTHVAGIITEAPQTPLSHINLKAKQNKTPNAYIKSASTNPDIAPLIGQIVSYEVTADGFDLSPASQAEADAWLESVRPANPQIPKSDLSEEDPTPLSAMFHDDWIRFGAKAANVAELNHLFRNDATVHTPDGYAVPFRMYDDFMSTQRCGVDQTEICGSGVSGVTLYDQARSMIESPSFQADAEVRKDALKAFRKQIEDSVATAEAILSLESIRTFWDPQGSPYETNLRCRSSTNNEDLESFNGAGLYESKTHKPSEGDLMNTVKEVWASLWTMRAFDERTFYRIDHFKTYMGVLIHPSYGDEQANGVGVTKNIYNPAWQGYYINAQYGEISVTNPEPEDAPPGATHATPDELLVSRLTGPGEMLAWETQYIRHSNVETIYNEQPVPTDDVLTEIEIERLRTAMQKIQAHFKPIYGGDNTFAVDIEFKITRTTDYDPDVGEQPERGVLSIKQARPWID